MKKELRSRIKNSQNHNKAENQTKPSEKKQRRKGIRHLAIAKPTTRQEVESQVHEPSDLPILKDES